MKNKFILLLVCFLSAISPLRAQTQTLAEKQKAQAAKQQAKVEKQKTQAKKKEAKETRQQPVRDALPMHKTSGTVYVFGTSTTLGTDEVYVTDITQIDSLALQKKTNFLPFRSSFSLQLQQYTEGTLGKTHQTTSVFFDKDKKKLERRLEKVKRHVLLQPEGTLTLINSAQFRFVHPLDLIRAAADSDGAQPTDSLK